MVAPSKLYEEPLRRIHCSQVLLHPNKTCLQFLLSNSYMHTLSTLKYFLPMLITPLFLKFKKLDRKALLNTFIFYLENSVWSAAASTIVFSTICLLRNYNGVFSKYTVTFLPTFIGTQLCWLFPDRVSRLFTTATSQASLEALLRLHAKTNSASKFLLNSRLIQTLLFMINSAIIMHYKRAKQYTGFWFIQPQQQDQETPQSIETKSELNGIRVQSCEEEIDEIYEDNEIAIETNSKLSQKENLTSLPNSCVHHQGVTCLKSILDGMKSYLLYGIPLDLLNMLTKGPLKREYGKSIIDFCFDKLKTLRFNMTAFFLSYVGIYRLTSCLLVKYFRQTSTNLTHLISALLGGCSYVFMDKITFLTLSIVLSTQILWQQFCKSPSPTTKTGRSTIVEYLKRIDFGRILTPLNMGLCVHCFVFHHHALNSLGRGFVNAISNKTSQRVYDILIARDLDYLLNEMYKQPAKSFCC